MKYKIVDHLVTLFNKFDEVYPPVNENVAIQFDNHHENKFHKHLSDCQKMSWNYIISLTLKNSVINYWPRQPMVWTSRQFKVILNLVV